MIRFLYCISLCLIFLQETSARADSSGFTVLGYQVKSKLGNMHSLNNLIGPASTELDHGEGFGNKKFFNRAQGMIVRYSLKSKALFEGSYRTTEFEAGFLVGRNDRDYHYRSYHSNDTLYYDRYIYDEKRDELYFSIAQTVTLPLTKRIKLSSGIRLSVQQSIYAYGNFSYHKSYKVKGTYSYQYNPDISDPDDIFGRPVRTLSHSGKLKASTAILAEVPLILAFKPFERISLLYEFRWGWGVQMTGANSSYKNIFGMGLGLGYDFN